jgi:hypothetical protein
LNTSSQIVYKVPDGVLPMDWNKSKFKGMLFLAKDSPSGIFIAFPNDEESLGELRERAAKFIAPMVVHDSKDLDPIPFETKAIASNKGDVSDRGRHYLFKGEKAMVQIFFFERATPASNVLYGYFAQKGNNEKKSKIWVGDDLKMPKVFTKFVGSFNVK